MNYLSQNNHKYLSNPQKLINFNGVKPSTADDTNPFIIYSTDVTTSLRWKIFDIVLHHLQELQQLQTML